MANNKQIWLLLACALVILTFLMLKPSFNSTNYARFEGGIDPRQTRRFRNIIVHLDLKGAPPRVDYLIKFFEFLSKFYVDGVLIEYEDMFPYTGKIEKIRRKDHYSEEDIRKILDAAENYNLEVIPLIQSFGHLEFLLKKPAFMHLSEDLIDLNTICISDPESIEIIESMILQIRKLHPNSTRIHIGSDEAYHVAEDKRCENRMESEKIGKSDLKMRHIAKIGKFAKETAGFRTVFAWNDMFDKETEQVIRSARVHEYIVPVVWGYREDVTELGYFPDGLFDRIRNVFDGFYVASAFKGANGARQQFPNISRYLNVHKSYFKLMDLHPRAAEKVQGIFVTGWSRFNHFNALCELLPVAIPSLITDLFFLNYQNDSPWNAMKNSLKCEIPANFRGILAEFALRNCQFPGAEVFEIIMNEWNAQVNRKLFKNDDENSEKAKEILEKLKKSLEPILFRSDIEEIYNQYLQDYNMISTTTTTPLS